MASTDGANYKRIMLRILDEIAEEQDIDLTVFSQGWIIRLAKANIVRFIYGYSFLVSLYKSLSYVHAIAFLSI